jgi:hypothetical protein
MSLVYIQTSRQLILIATAWKTDDCRASVSAPVTHLHTDFSVYGTSLMSVLKRNVVWTMFTNLDLSLWKVSVLCSENEVQGARSEILTYSIMKLLYLLLFTKYVSWSLLIAINLFSKYVYLETIKRNINKELGAFTTPAFTDGSELGCWGSVPGRGKRISSYSRREKLFCDPHTLLQNGHQSLIV